MRVMPAGGDARLLALSRGLDRGPHVEGAVTPQPSPGFAVIADRGREESPTSQARRRLHSEGRV